MKYFPVLFLSLAILVTARAADSSRAARTVVLDAAGVANLGLKVVSVEEGQFETTVFALGRIEAIPERHAVLTSRIAGRIAEVRAFAGDSVQAGAEVARVETRTAGNPPPTVTLTAPASGLVVRSDLVLGAPVEPSEELLEITNLDEMWAVARVPESKAARLVPGQTEARVTVPALGREPITGRLLRFGTTADPDSGTIDAIFLIKNPDHRLRAGMWAEFSIIVSRRDGVMTIPREAVQGDPAGRVVYVKDFDLPNAFVRVPVRLGESNDRSVEVVGGLFPGDEVVTTGSYQLGFAGQGSLSLKEALDAAHGHAHNEDGSEITPGQVADAKTAPAAPAGDRTLVLALTTACVVLAGLLVLSLFRRRTPC